MKNIDLGQILGILGNLGVIAGIVFLGIELAQNNEYAATEIRATRYHMSLDAFTIIAENPELAAIVVKDRDHETLSELESLQLRAWWTRVLLTNQWAHSEMDVADNVPFMAMQRANNESFPAYSKTWEVRKLFFEPDFAQFMEENVFNQ